MRYKTWFVAQEFSQIPGIEFNETYSPVVNTSVFFIFNSLVAHILHIMDITTNYLYSSLDSEIYTKFYKKFIYVRHIILDLKKTTL